MIRRGFDVFWRAGLVVGITAVALFALFSMMPASASAAAPGDIVINEILQNPSSVSDGSGEWFELYNATGSDIDLAGWTIADADNDSFVVTTTVIVPAGGYVVFGNNGDSGTNGGVTVDYAYNSGGFFLSNGSDELILTDTTNIEIDRVDWDNGATFPDPNGSSMSLISPALDNNVGTNWCEASTPFGSGDNGTPGAANDCPTADAELTVSKSAAATVGVGDPLVYDITVSNNGTVDATNVMLTDTLPLSTTFVASDLGTPTMISGNVYQWSLGTVAATTSASYQLTVTVDANLTAGSTLTNVVAVSTDEASDDNSDNSDTAVTTAVSTLADMAIGVTAPPYGIIGDSLNYTVYISNNHNSLATDVVFTATLPVSTTYAGDDSGLMPTSVGNNTYVWSLGDIISDTNVTVNLTVTVDANVASGTTLTNTVWVSTSRAGDDLSNNSDMATTAVYPLVSIYDIQDTTVLQQQNGGTASPLVGEIVWTEGIVTSQPSDIDINQRMMVIQDAAGGAWSGVAVFRASNFDTVWPEGTHVRVLGTVEEFFDFTQLGLTNSPWAVEVMGSAAVPAPEVLSTADFDELNPATSEQWEGVYIQFEGATVTDDDLGFSEWAFDDGSGPARADDLGDRDGNLTYAPTNGDEYQYLRGIGWYSFGNYKLLPRNDGDVALAADAPAITKEAPPVVEVGETFTYTINVVNHLGYDLTTVTITDVVPAGVDVAAVLDGGSENSGVVSWNIASIANLADVSVQFVVTATGDSPVVINDDYAVVASNYVTATFGDAVVTTADRGGTTPIPLIQGDSDVSPFEGGVVTVNGVVVGFFEGNSNGDGNFDGFFLQDPIGDSNSDTSDGILIDYGSLSLSVAVGDIVTVTGTVEEYSEWEGNQCPADEGCVTQIAVDSTGDVVVGGTDTIAATVIDPPGDPVAADEYFESLEGMLVTLPMTGVVAGPTSFGAIAVVPGDEGVSRVLRGSPQEGMVFGVRHYELFGDINGSDPDSLIVGSVVANVDGPFTFSYGNYMVATQAGNPWTTVSSAPAPVQEPEAPEAGLGALSVASLNTLNFDAGDSADKMTKVVNTIISMGAPTFLAVEEITVDDVMADLITNLSNAGYDYDFSFTHPDVGNHGVALLWRTDRVSDVTTGDLQGCSANGSSSSTAYDDFCDGTGLLPAFSRRPVVVTATVGISGSDDLTVVVIGNHFKSKLGGIPSDLRRLDQAMVVADAVDNFVANTTPYVVVMGDLNDFEDSPPLQALYASGNLTQTWTYIPAEERYSFIFGGVSQILDHVLLSPAFLDWVDEVTPLHANADFPFFPYSNDASNIWRTSDHDPLVVLLTAPPAPPVVPPMDIELSGPDTGIVDETYGFTIAVTPVSATLPMTLTWEVTDGDMAWSVWLTDTLEDSFDYAWDMAGVKHVTVTAENEAGSVMATHTITITEPPAMPPTEIELSGPDAGMVDETYSFSASVLPVSTTLPLTLTWEVTDGDMAWSVWLTDTLSDNFDYAWDMPGVKQVMVTAENEAGSVMATHTITITAPNTDTADVQVVHLAPFATGDAAVDVYLNGAATLSGFAYGESTGYLNLPVDTYLVEVTPAGSTTVVVSTVVTLTANMDYTIVAAGGANGQPLQLIVLVDNVAPVLSGGSGYVRLGHLAPFAADTADTAVNIINDADDTVLLSGVVYGDITGYLPFPSGSYDLRVELAADDSVLFDLAPITVTEDAFITAFAAGDGANQTPDVLGVLGDAGTLPSLLQPTYQLYLPVLFNN